LVSTTPFAPIDEACWRRLHRPAAAQPRNGQPRRREPNHKQRIVTERGYLNLQLHHEDVAEFTYQPGKYRRPYRVVVVRKNISKTRGEHVLFDEIRYFFYITTRTDLTAAEVVACANDRCDQENIIEQLKNGVNALRVPLYDLVSNWAYMVIAALAWNIKSWFAMMLHRKPDRRDYIRWNSAASQPTSSSSPPRPGRVGAAAGHAGLVRIVGGQSGKYSGS
jgi:hypothetical protein